MQCVYKKNLVEIYRVTPNLYFRKGDLHTRSQCNGAFLVNNGVVGAVDATSMEGSREMMEEAMLLFGQPIRYVFLTHGHEDHVDGLPVFLDQEVTIFCSYRLIDQIAPAGSQYKASIVGVQGNMQLRLAGLEVELFTFPDTAHSPWDMFVRLTKEQCICTGDAVVEFETLYYHTANVTNWIASLRKLSMEAGKYVLPGHGNVYPYTIIGEVAEFIETVQRAAQHCIKQASEEEIKKMDDAKVNTLISEYLSNGDADALAICKKAGEDAQREVRMVIWSLTGRPQ